MTASIIKATRFLLLGPFIHIDSCPEGPAAHGVPGWISTKSNNSGFCLQIRSLSSWLDFMSTLQPTKPSTAYITAVSRKFDVIIIRPAFV